MSIPMKHVIVIQVPHGTELNLIHVSDTSIFDKDDRALNHSYLGYVLELEDYIWVTANMLTKPFIKVCYCTNFDEFNSLLSAFHLNVDIKELFL